MSPDWLEIGPRLSHGASAIAYLAKAPPFLVSTLRGAALREAAAPSGADAGRVGDAGALADASASANAGALASACHLCDAGALALRVTLPAAAEFAGKCTPIGERQWNVVAKCVFNPRDVVRHELEFVQKALLGAGLPWEPILYSWYGDDEEWWYVQLRLRTGVQWSSPHRKFAISVVRAAAALGVGDLFPDNWGLDAAGHPVPFDANTTVTPAVVERAAKRWLDEGTRV